MQILRRLQSHGRALRGSIRMQTGPVSFTSMRRRIVLVVTIAILMALGAASWIAVLVIVTDRDADLADRVSGLAPAFARQLESRLQMANALVQFLSSTDAGSEIGRAHV